VVKKLERFKTISNKDFVKETTKGDEKLINKTEE
jgi:hypothetical protein